MVQSTIKLREVKENWLVILKSFRLLKINCLLINFLIGTMSNLATAVCLI